MSKLLISILIINYTLSIIGLYLVRKHMILIVLCFEILIIIMYILFSTYGILLDLVIGDFMGLTLFIIGLVETVIGISLIVRYFRINGTIAYDNINKLRNHYNILLKC